MYIDFYFLEISRQKALVYKGQRICPKKFYHDATNLWNTFTHCESCIWWWLLCYNTINRTSFRIALTLKGIYLESRRWQHIRNSIQPKMHIWRNCLHNYCHHTFPLQFCIKLKMLLQIYCWITTLNNDFTSVLFLTTMKHPL